MLELYHHGSSVCAAKVRLALAEKGVAVDRYHYVDILKGEQFSESYRKINPSCVVPSMVHDGRILNESTLICEYIDRAFDGPRLRLDGAYDKYRVSVWTKAVDELLHPACSEVTYVSCHRHIIRRLPPDELEAYFERTPARSVKGDWRARKRELVMQGFEAPGVEAHFHLYDRYLNRMEEALDSGLWLTGARFTLADIAMAPYVLRLEMLGMQGFWANGRLPRVEDWYTRLKARATFKPALPDWCPADLRADLERYGAESWPSVRRIVGIP
jgi:ganglioside-induced differentiation-associated protein 1